MTAEVMSTQEETQTAAAEVVVDAAAAQEGKKVVDVEEPKESSVENDEHEHEQHQQQQPKTKTVEKSSSYKEESNFLSDLKEFEKKALNDLKSKLEEAISENTLFEKEEGAEEEEAMKKNDVSLWGVPLLPSKGAEGTDVVLLKFLRAREFKVNDAFEMLKKTLKWRKESKVDSVLDEDFGSGLATAAYMNGVDREGHPVCYNIFGVFDGEELYQKTFGTQEKRVEFLRWRCQLMEKGIQKLHFKPGGVSSLLQINDLKNSPGPSKKELRIATKQTVSMLQDNYPEMVAKNVSCFEIAMLSLSLFFYDLFISCLNLTSRTV